MAVIAVAAGYRHSLPAWMTHWFVAITFPLFVYNLTVLLWRERIQSILTRYPWLLTIDLVMAVAILAIGGGWRSSYYFYPTFRTPLL